jgi:membrane-associated PAP2 superfamily phosphatase
MNSTTWVALYTGPLIATIAIIAISICVRLFDLDIQIAHLFYDPEKGFFLEGTLLERIVKKSIDIAVIISLVFYLGYFMSATFFKKGRKQSRLAITLFLSLVIGPGLIVNDIFKENWGRPRPYRTLEFGGIHEPKQLLEYNWGNYGDSFPSGHAAFPLAFLVLAFAARDRNNRRLAVRLATGIGLWYIAVAVARVVAGKHHFSDVLWAGYISYMVAWFAHQLILKRHCLQQQKMIE